MNSHQKSKPIIVGGDGYYPVAHREEENFAEIRARMEKENNENAEGKKRAPEVSYPTGKIPSEYDIDIGETVRPATVISPRPVANEKKNESDTVVSASELFGNPGYTFTEDYERSLRPNIKGNENLPLRAPEKETVKSSDGLFPSSRDFGSTSEMPIRPVVQPRPTVVSPILSPERPITPPVQNNPTPVTTVVAEEKEIQPPVVEPKPQPQVGSDSIPPRPYVPTFKTPDPIPVHNADLVSASSENAFKPDEKREIERNPYQYTVTERSVSDSNGSSEASVGPVFEQTRIPEVNVSGYTPTQTVPASPTPDPYADYTPPPLSLLKAGSSGISASSEEEIRRNAENLIDTLESFNIPATINHVSRGPRITRYELRPDKGIRVRSIANLIDDISMSLATPGIRIEAPIPGVAAVGVEVPNKEPTAVRLRDMLNNDKFRSASSKTTVCMGSDVTGEPVYGDIAKMPHALIAGATGMGKSVCINSILISLLYKARPDEVKLILVDPKKVELNVYNGIPHLLVPVVVEAQKAAGALVWAVGEMERRFSLIESVGVRDLKGYNRVVAEHPEMKGGKLPQIVIVIDELHDLMMSAADAVEDAICRIAQKARAAGIHLLIGTQRPSVDVITGVIKANIPSRVAFHVASQVDSRTILDMGGADKLLDKGDMLFFPVGTPKPMRVQGSLVEDDEVERVTTYLKQSMKTGAVYDDDIMANIEREAAKCAPKEKKSDRDMDRDEFGDDEDVFNDPQFVAAIEIAIQLGQISTSKIQTKLRIGFQKATNYVETMEEMGIVGPLNGSKPREVLISADQWLEMKARH